MLRTRINFLAIAMFAISFQGTGHAAEVKLGGLIFTHFEYVLSDYLSNGTRADDRNAFDVSRVYLNGSSKLDDKYDVFVQLETNQSSRDNTANQTYLKQAWLRWTEIYPGANLRLGLVPAPWRSFEESIWGHRYVAKILEDEEGLLFASDRGVSIAGKHSILSYEALVGNGEGTGARGTTGNETNKYKDYAARISVAPFQDESLKGLKFNLFGQKGNKGADWPRDRIFGGVSYESPRFNFWSTYYSSRDGKGVASGTDTVKGVGISVHGTFNFAQKYSVFGRYDRWDPNKDVSNDSHDRIIYGLEKKFSDNVRGSIDHQLIQQEKQTATQKNQSIIFTHVEVKF